MANTQNPIITEAAVRARLEKNPFEKIAVIVRDIMKEAIIRLEIAPGSKINMAQIAGRLNVSRTPVKEALNMLVKEGLVRTDESKSGYFAFDLTDQYMEHFWAARSAIESAAAALCAANSHRLDLSEMRRLCDCVQEYFQNGEYEKLVENDMTFHRMLIRYAGNPFLSEMYGTLEQNISYYSSRSIDYLRKYSYSLNDNYDLLVYQHRTILNAILSGIPDLAGSAVKQHIASADSMFIRYYLMH